MEKLPLAEYLKRPEYDVSHLPGPLLVAYGGSMAYGLNHEDSDVDLKGLYMGSKKYLLLQKGEKFWVSKEVDSTMYTLHYGMQLLTECNPSALEMLFTLPEDRVYLSPLGEKLVRNRNLFLSKYAVNAYVGYCTKQLYKMENALARDRSTDTQKEAHILDALQRMERKLDSRYQGFADGEIKLYLDKSSKPNRDEEVFIDLNLKKYPLRDLRNSLGDFTEMVTQFDGKGSKHRSHKKDDLHLCKHATHMLRVLIECRDLLRDGTFCTLQTAERPVLLAVLNGEYLNEDGTWDMESFMKVLEEYKFQVNEAAKHAVLPETVDMRKLEKLEMELISEYLQTVP